MIESAGKDGGERSSEGGRPAELLRLRGDTGAVISVDFGRSHLRAAAVDLRADLDAVEIFPPKAEISIDVGRDSAGALRGAIPLIQQAMAAKRISPEELVGVCVGVSAPIDLQTGLIATTEGMRSWQGIRPADELRYLLGRDWQDVPFMLENDANLALLAELEFGAARQAFTRESEQDIVILVKWAGGIGMSVAVDGRIVHGTRGLAGEFGHTVVDTRVEGEACAQCGKVCLESVAGGDALVGRILQQTGASRANLAEIIQQAVDGSEPDRSLLLEAAETVGRALGPIVTTLNPRLVVIGGRFAGAPETTVYTMTAEAIRRGWRATAFSNALDDADLSLGERSRQAAAEGGLIAVLRSELTGFLERKLAAVGRV